MRPRCSDCRLKAIRGTGYCYRLQGQAAELQAWWDGMIEYLHHNGRTAQTALDEVDAALRRSRSDKHER